MQIPRHILTKEKVFQLQLSMDNRTHLMLSNLKFRVFKRTDQNCDLSERIS